MIVLAIPVSIQYCIIRLGVLASGRMRIAFDATAANENWESMLHQRAILCAILPVFHPPAW